MTQTMESLEQGLEALALDLDGRLVRPTDTDWDQARAAWNLTVDQAPTAVALPETVRDIQTVVRAAGRLGLRVAPQATGHNAMPLGPLDRTILLSLARMRYEQGVTDFLQVLLAQQNLLSADQALADSTTTVTTNMVQLYKSLGGGWQPDGGGG